MGMFTEDDFRDDLVDEQKRLYNAIRKVRDNFGDDKCWMDWEALFQMLPEGYSAPSQDIKIQLKNCEQYLSCLSKNTEYIPPPRWIKGLPDKPGIWILTTNKGYRFAISCGIGINDYKDERIICSFGPIPREPM